MGEKKNNSKIYLSFSVPYTILSLPRWRSGKESACQCRRCGFDPWVGKIPWRRKWQMAPMFLPGESQEQRSLSGYSTWGHKRVQHDWTLHIIATRNNIIYAVNCFPGWRRQWYPTKVFLPGETYGQRSLVGYCPWRHKESDMTEQLTHTLLPW